MTIRNNYPNVRPTLLLDFARTQQLDPRITFTRDSIATRTNQDGYVSLVANNVPRFDFDPITMESKGLIIEESRTNLLKYSEQINVSPWATIGANVAITANTTTAPDGTLSADSLTTSTWASGDSFYQDIAATGNGTYTLSAFVKANTVSTITLAVFFTGNSTEGSSFGFNPNTGVITGGTGYIIPYQNGWYRIYFSMTGTNALNTTLRWQIYLNATGSVYVWGAQCEAGAFLTSYIPTTGSTVTRAAEVASITGTNFTSWFNNSEGSLYLDATFNYQATTQGYPQLLSLVGSNYNTDAIGLYTVTTPSASAGYTAGVVTLNGADEANLSGGAQTMKGYTKACLAYKRNSFNISVFGLIDFDDTAVNLPVCQELHIFGLAKYQLQPSGTIKKVAYYPYRLTNAQLQALTIP